MGGDTTVVPNICALRAKASLRALGVSQISLYQLHAPDPSVPIEESIGELERLRAEGKIASLGLSNVSVGELERAQAVAPIACVQNEASVLSPGGLRDGVLRRCEQLGVAFVAHSPMGGWRAGRIAHEVLLQKVAKQVSATPHQVALAWLLAQSDALIAIPGASRPRNAVSSARAADIVLGDAQLAELSECYLGVAT